MKLFRAVFGSHYFFLLSMQIMNGSHYLFLSLCHNVNSNTSLTQYAPAGRKKDEGKLLSVVAVDTTHELHCGTNDDLHTFYLEIVSWCNIWSSGILFGAYDTKARIEIAISFSNAKLSQLEEKSWCHDFQANLG